MGFEIRQTQKLDQSIALTPQLKKSLEILQKPSLELHEFLSEELRTNPLLEDMSGEYENIPEQIGENPDVENDSSESEENASDREEENRKRDFMLNSLPDKISLREHLLNESKLDAENADTAEAFEFLISFMDERGFLPSDAQSKLEDSGFSPESARAAIKLLRDSDPPGIGASDMRDSLMLQLERKGMGDSLPYRILDRDYELLMRRKVSEIADLENTTPAEVESAIAQIAKLNTSPAKDFSREDPRFIKPDIAFKLDDSGEWTAELTNEYIPRLRINPDYRRLLADGKLRESEETYIREKIREGKFLMDAIEQRQNTLLRIGRSILERQREYFEGGPEDLKPMTMQDVADDVHLHPSTVGRAIAEKYADTPFGITPLKSFFSGGYESLGGESVASASVKSRIRSIVESESPQSPLSDSKIAEILSGEGLNIARRTIAKYREELGIAPKNLRKRF